MKVIRIIFVFTLIVAFGQYADGQAYKPKKVPSMPLNIQGLAQDIHKELLMLKIPLKVNDKEYFALDERDPSMFEFYAHRTIGKSGERSVKFIVLKGKIHYAREIDEETGKIAQGVLYNDMKDRWEKYLRAKERGQTMN
jgi:hypothetical protein